MPLPLPRNPIHNAKPKTTEVAVLSDNPHEWTKDANPGYESVPVAPKGVRDFQSPLGMQPVSPFENSMPGPGATVPVGGLVPPPEMPRQPSPTPQDTASLIPVAEIEAIPPPAQIAAQPPKLETIVVDWHGSRFPITFDRVWYQPAAGDLPGFLVLIHDKGRDSLGPAWSPPKNSKLNVLFRDMWFQCVHLNIELSLPLGGDYVLMALIAEPLQQVG